MKKIVLLGSGGHARVVVDSIMQTNSYEIVGFVGPEDCSYRSYRRIGDDADLDAIRAAGVDHAFVCLGFLGKGTVRQELFSRLKSSGFIIPSIVDPSAKLALDVYLGEGVYVGKMAVLNSGATVGDAAIVNTGAIVEHDCAVGAFSHISVNATLCGGVSVGEATFVGASAVVLQGVQLGDRVIVGANSTVLKSVADDTIIVGVYDG